MTFDEFERRVEAVPDMQMNWIYWNVWIPETSLLWLYMILHALNRLAATPPEARAPHQEA
jgi:hypothetical protein